MNDFREYSAAFHAQNDDILHFGILGMKWGVRRYQNSDGTLTPAGKKRYGDTTESQTEYEKQRNSFKTDEEKDLWEREQDVEKVYNAIEKEGFKDDGTSKYTLYKTDGKDTFGLPKKDNKVDGDPVNSYRTYKRFMTDKKTHDSNIRKAILNDSYINEFAREYHVSPKKLKSILENKGMFYDFGTYGNGVGIVNFMIGINQFGGHFISGTYDPVKKKTSYLSVEG